MSGPFDDGFTPDGMSALNPEYEEQCQRWQEELAKQECEHPYISWHGSRAECQDCGEYI